MRRMHTLVLLIGLSSVAAAQSNPAPSTAPRPASDTARAGTYDLELTMDEGTVTGELALTRTAQGYDAKLIAGGNTPTVNSFVRQGAGYVLSAGHGDFSIVYNLRFANDSLTGTFKSPAFSGSIAGARRK